MNVRESFVRRLDALVTHFNLHAAESCSFAGTTQVFHALVIQLMNDFPRWKPDELDLVAKRANILRQHVSNLYLGSWLLIREPALDLHKHKNIRSTDSGFIAEIQGQAWEPPKNSKPFGNNNNPPECEYEYDSARTDEMYRDFFHARTGGQKSGPTAMEEMLRKAAGQGSRAGFDTKKAWSSAPAYLHLHLEVLQMKYPITLDDAKKQFRKRAMDTHPDRNPTKGDEFKKVSAAWKFVREFLEKK